jgi:hypothetical protein
MQTAQVTINGYVYEVPANKLDLVLRKQNLVSVASSLMTSGAPKEQVETILVEIRKLKRRIGKHTLKFVRIVK